MIGGDSEQFSNFQDQFGSGHVFAGFEVAAVAVLILYKYIVILSSITTLKEGDSVNLLNLDPQPLRGAAACIAPPALSQRPRGGLIFPLLPEKHAGLGAGVRLESVGVQADHRQNAASLHDEFTQALVR